MHPSVPLLRYMDDILVLCNEEDNVARLHQDLDELVRAGELELKYDYPAAQHALSKDAVSWLGYRISKGTEGMEIHLPFIGSGKSATAWREYLPERFSVLHDEPDAPVAAVSLIQGIIAWAGPALPWSDTRAVYEILRKAARSAAFEEIPSHQAIEARWRKRHAAWRRHCGIDAALVASHSAMSFDDNQEYDDSEAPF
jgi:hypothetical protein